MTAFENMNPFNPPADSPMAARFTEQLNAMFTALEAKAKAK